MYNYLKKTKPIFEKLKKAKKISLFIHEKPDFDALSSALALQDYLVENKHDARIIALDEVDKEILAKFYEPVNILTYDDDFIKNSTAVILDTANDKRVLSQKHKLSNTILRIDHHPKIENIGCLEWIDDNMSSTSEMVAWLLLQNDKKNGLNKRRCNFLYTGIISDTNRFMYNLTKASTFNLVEQFYQYGFEKENVQNKFYIRDLKQIKIDQKLIRKIHISNNVAFLIINKSLSKRLAKKTSLSKVYLMNDLKDVNIWMCAYYDNDNKKWMISLRSKNYNVKEIASHYNGGGHLCAAGIKLSNKIDLTSLITELKKINWDDDYLKINSAS